jgi:hypothetical protein
VDRVAIRLEVNYAPKSEGPIRGAKLNEFTVFDSGQFANEFPIT